MQVHPIPESDAGQSNAVLIAALTYYALGWSIIPINPRSKKPVVSWKRYQTNRATEPTVRKWFGGPVAKNVAVVCGSVSNGLCVRDFDAEGSYERWATENPSLAATLPTVATGRGHHVYFRADPPTDRIVYLDDGELRGGGCYCLAPPSIHPSGAVYRWLVPLVGELPVLSPEVFCDSGNTEDTENTKDTENEAGKSVDGTDPPKEESSQSTPSIDRVNTEDTENTDSTEDTDHSLPSVSSVFSVFQQDLKLAIRRTLPPGPGRRQRKLFDLARELQAIPEIAALPVEQLRPIVAEWHQLALPYIRTKSFTETWLDFKRAWANVKYPAGENAVDVAYQRAVEAEPPAVVADWDSEPLRHLAALCRELQRGRGNGRPFYLDSRTAGRLLCVPHSRAWKWLRMLCDEGILELVTPGSRRDRKANEYRYLAED